MFATIQNLARACIFCTLCATSAYFLTADTYYSTQVTQWPENLNPGFYLVLNTDKIEPNLEIMHQKSAKKTYFGPSYTIKDSYQKYSKIKSLHPGIHLNLIKIDDKAASTDI
ncbi:hypothetical protein MMH89_01510 [Candidatus Comchoanobacter bicostacola]|uniref:Uncharacterized protein n=1 Tax=Candidatus Comchoanobacter bicostacola TaxID=2919598 RepID=A0ABY5DK09_9GAMM|nr:hypothetical protein [Candidatus Comchoanobacter bicostacola]UTC24828.1 hypothetical protein MMH89_01510 [Candidatus Comchoanobacter bicostacola]